MPKVENEQVKVENDGLLDLKKFIYIKGAKMHNLKNIDVTITRNAITVVTGLSGSGKSSLAFDTLFAEGQRRYVESLSSYARQFLGKIEKPDVDHIYGIAPAVAIEQKVNTVNKRSTVGTSTEIYDYLKLLYARIGKTYSPVSGKQVKRDTVEDVVKLITSFKVGAKVVITAPIVSNGTSFLETMETYEKRGFSRVWFDNKVHRIEQFKEQKHALNDVQLLMDRLVVNEEDEEQLSRVRGSIEGAFVEGDGACQVILMDEVHQLYQFNNRFEIDGMEFELPSVHFFSFNNPIGACKVCGGYGSVIGIDEDLVIPDKSLSVYQDAIVCWKGEKMQEWKKELVMSAPSFDFPIHKPIYELSDEQMQLLWDGNKHFQGLNAFFKMVEDNSYKIQYRVMLSRYRGKTVCMDCKGTRLRKDASYVKVGGKSITEMVLMPIKGLKQFFDELELDDTDIQVADRLLTEIRNRLGFLDDVGLGYLTLNRLSSTLSGGESQRINLATSLGSSLVGSMYILDEPSIGLHSRDTERLMKVLISLQQLGNTVIVVEHDEDIIREANYVIDIGPMAGDLGGEVVFQGSYKELLANGDSLTAQYINGKEKIAVPAMRRKSNKSIELHGARENNLKGIKVKFPLHVLVAVTGVSGSGKSSLIKKCLLPVLKKRYEGYGEQSGQIDQLSGAVNDLTGVEFVDQNPIGKSSRSNPVTYVKAYDDIRSFFAGLPLAKKRGYKPSFFSFNIDGGRCDNCKGEGEIVIEMQFMADIHMTCEVCNGKRFKEELLEVKYQGKDISDILEMTVDHAIAFFDDTEDAAAKKIAQKLSPLQEVGLGYISLGQSSNTLSGGEAQRVKLATFLAKKNSSNQMLFVFDEPTTGLHFHDVKKLLKAFNALIAQGHSIIVIEHNLDVVKCADWVIDMGPEGGDEGGTVLFEGTPEELILHPSSHTAKYLKEKIV